MYLHSEENPDRVHLGYRIEMSVGYAMSILGEEFIDLLLRVGFRGSVFQGQVLLHACFIVQDPGLYWVD